MLLGLGDNGCEHDTVDEQRHEQAACENDPQAVARPPATSTRPRQVVHRGTGARHGPPQGDRVEHARFDPFGEGGSFDQPRALGPSQLGIDENELRADAVGVNGGDLLCQALCFLWPLSAVAHDR